MEIELLVDRLFPERFLDNILLRRLPMMTVYSFCSNNYVVEGKESEEMNIL